MALVELERLNFSGARAWLTLRNIIDQAMGLKKSAGQLAHAFGSIDHYEGRLQEAHAWYLKALDATTESSELSKIQRDLGILAQDLGDLDQAYHWAQKSLASSQSAPHVSSQ